MYSYLENFLCRLCRSFHQKLFSHNMPFYCQWSPQVKQKLLTTCLILTFTLAEFSYVNQYRSCFMIQVFMIQELSSIQSQTYSSFYYTTALSIIRSTKDGFIFLLYNNTVHYQSLQPVIVVTPPVRNEVAEAATQRHFQGKVFWKYAAILQENTHYFSVWMCFNEL